MNIRTASDLANMPAGFARKQFRIEVKRTVRELNGQVCKMCGEARADKKQIFATRSMGERITDFKSLLQALSKHVGIAATKARKQGSTGKTMLLFASHSPYDERPVSYKTVVYFLCSTNCTIELTKAICEAVPNLLSSQNHRLWRW